MQAPGQDRSVHSQCSCKTHSRPQRATVVATQTASQPPKPRWCAPQVPASAAAPILSEAVRCFYVGRFANLPKRTPAGRCARIRSMLHNQHSLHLILTACHSAVSAKHTRTQQTSGWQHGLLLSRRHKTHHLAADTRVWCAAGKTCKQSPTNQHNNQGAPRGALPSTSNCHLNAAGSTRGLLVRPPHGMHRGLRLHIWGPLCSTDTKRHKGDTPLLAGPCKLCWHDSCQTHAAQLFECLTNPGKLRCACSCCLWAECTHARITHSCSLNRPRACTCV